MTKIKISGKEHTLIVKKSDKDSVKQNGSDIIIETNEKHPNTLLKEYLTEILYHRLSKIYDQIRGEGNIGVIGSVDFEIVDKIDNKRKRLAKFKGDRILFKLSIVALPDEALKYIVAHEMAHAFTKTHSKKFWKMVEAIHPNYREAQAIITENNESLLNPIKPDHGEDAHPIQAHVSEPLEPRAIKKDLEEPEKRRVWEARLGWVEPSIKELTLHIIDEIRSRFSDVEDRPSGRYYLFDKGQSGSGHRFAALIPTKKSLKVRIRVDPHTLTDPKNWIGEKLYKRWFFSGPGEEREFKIDNIDQIDYALELIAQSYNLTK
jgi:predicted transport protein